MKKIMILFLCGFVGFSLIGCGVKGDLYFPQEPQKNNANTNF